MKKLLLFILSVVYFGFLSAQTPPVIYVSPSGTGSGSSWSDAASLECALGTGTSCTLGAIPSGAQIWLKAGTYRPIGTVRIPSGVKVYGGFSGTEASVSERNYAVNATIIDAVKTFGPVVHLAPSSALDGVTVQNGLTATLSDSNGGGVYMEPDSRVENSRILNSFALHSGGGIYAEGDGLVANTLIQGNKSLFDGFAVYGTTLKLVNNTITENQKMSFSYQDSVDLFDPAPVPDSAILNPLVCYGRSVELGVSGPLYNTLLWSTGQTTPVIETGPLFATTAYSVIIISAEREKVMKLIFTVHVKPEPELTLSGNRDTAFGGDTVVITAVASPSGGTYAWSRSDSPLDEDSVISAVMPQAGDLQQRCTYTLDGCSVSETHTVVNAVCTPPVAADSLTMDGSVACAGNGVVLHVHGGARNSGEWLLFADSCAGKPLQQRGSPRPDFEVYPDTTTTYYAALEGCGIRTSCVTITVKVMDAPVISGAQAVCTGDSIQLTALPSGGSWEKVWWGFYALDTVSGWVRGEKAGTSRLKYTLPNGCFAEHRFEVSLTPSPVNPDTNLCQGALMQHYQQDGLWNSSDVSVAEVEANGEVKGKAVGTASLTYTAASGCSFVKTIHVRLQPEALAIQPSLCENDSVQLSNATPGGVWSIAGYQDVASISPSGLLKGLSYGKTTAAYNLEYCSDTVAITVNSAPTSIGVTSQFCVGAYASAVIINPVYRGGTWNSSDPSVAEITPKDSALALIRGLKGGTFDLTYTSPAGCAVTVKALAVHPNPAPIQGDRLVGIDESITLTNDTTGAEWHWRSANSAIATIDLSTGELTGKAAGSTLVYFQNSGTFCYDTVRITVTPCAKLTETSSGAARQSVCFEQQITPVTLTAFGGVHQSSISWKRDGQPSAMPQGLSYNTSTHSLSGTPTQSGTFEWTVQTTDHSPQCPAATFSGVLRVFAKVSAGDILAEQNICSGASPQTITASPGSGGNPNNTFTYRWQQSADSITFTDIASADAMTYTPELLTETTTTLKRFYRRIYSRPCGADTSNVHVLTVNPLPEAVAAADVTVTDNTSCTGANGSITVNSPAPGTGYEYSCNAGADFQTGNVFSTLEMGDYTVVVRKTATGCASDASKTLAVSVNENTSGNDGGTPIITGFTVSPNDSVCVTQAGAPMTITPIYANAGSSPSFAWSDGAAANSEVLATTVPPATTKYSLVITNQQTGCVTSVANPANSITVYIASPTVIADVDPSFDTACVNQDPLILTSKTTDKAGQTYKWYTSANNAFWVAVPGATARTLSVPQTPGKAYFKSEVTAADRVCPAVATNSHLVAMYAQGVITSLVNDSICYPGGVMELAVNTNAGAPPVNWYDAPTGGNILATTASGEVFQTPGLTASKTYYAEFAEQCGGIAARTAVKAVVMPLHSVQAVSGTNAMQQTVCAYADISTITLAYSGGASEGEIFWSPQTPQGIALNGGVTLTGAPTAQQGTYLWKVITKGNACTPDTINGSVTVMPTPTLQDIAQTPFCDSTVLSTAINNSVPGTVYWQNTNSGGTYTTLGNPPKTVIANGTYFFRAKSADEKCWGPQKSTFVTIQTQLSITTQPNAAELTTYIGTAFNPATLTVTAKGANLTYEWRRVSASFTGAHGAASGEMAPGVNTAAAYALPYGVVGAWKYFCVVKTTAANPCGGVTELVSNLSGVRRVSLPANGCDFINPAYTKANITSASFASPQTWKVGNQEWSDVVVSPQCNKNTIIHSNKVPYNIDCRRAVNGFQGHYITWCAVMKYQDVLCPDGWRVPTMEDFVALDIALGGNGQNSQSFNARRTAYCPATGYSDACQGPGGTWGGHRWTLNSDISTAAGSGGVSYYMTSSNADSQIARALAFNQTTYQRVISPRLGISKGIGFALRCVRGIEK